MCQSVDLHSDPFICAHKMCRTHFVIKMARSIKFDLESDLPTAVQHFFFLSFTVFAAVASSKAKICAKNKVLQTHFLQTKKKQEKEEWNENVLALCENERMSAGEVCVRMCVGHHPYPVGSRKNNDGSRLISHMLWQWKKVFHFQFSS